MPHEPLVTVLMAVHNDRQFLPESVNSILGQSFPDFEFLIIDDACNDGCSDILRAIDDPRVCIITNRTNHGLTRSLNIGLNHARGRFIARMDADDVAEPDRLLQQLRFMRSHPDVGLLGTSRTVIDEAGDVVAIAPATSGPLNVLWKMLLGNAFAHPTVMLRREVLERHRLRYDERFETAQDYELWVRLLQHTTGDNLGEPLVRYRLRDGISRTRKPQQLANHDRIAHSAITAILPELGFSLETVRQLRGRFGGFSVREPSMDPADEHWMDVYAQMLGAFVHRFGQTPDVRGFPTAKASPAPLRVRRAG